MYVEDKTMLRQAHRLAPPRVDILEAGAGPLVVLVHASMAGAHQWKSLIVELEARFLVRAVNLFGYGGTPAWSAGWEPSLDDFAELVLQAVPPGTEISLVGHSLGGAVAMQAARRLKERVRSLVLIEPSLFSLLEMNGREEAFHEIRALARRTTGGLAVFAPEAAAEEFMDYWCGPGTWAAMPPRGQRTILGAIPRLPEEWNALLEGRARLVDWRTSLPSQTLLMTFAGTVRPSREIVELLSKACPDWEIASIREGGHMGPLTHPHIVNPIIRNVLARSRELRPVRNGGQS